MSDDPKHNPSQTRRRAATVAIAFFSLITLYLTGFVVALTVGPGLSPPCHQRPFGSLLAAHQSR